MRAGHIRNPSLAFLPFTVGYGAVFTFVPLWHRAESSAVLLMFAVGFTGCRVLVGRYVTEPNARGLLTIAAAVGCAANVGAVYASAGWLVPLGLVIGSAVGSAATLTMFLLTATASDAERGASAALWSVAFDGGIGLGALGLAIVADAFGHTSVYVVVAACMALVALLMAPRREAHA
jgi:predicted MFS family arabinose efflux permease